MSEDETNDIDSRGGKCKVANAAWLRHLTPTY